MFFTIQDSERLNRDVPALGYIGAAAAAWVGKTFRNAECSQALPKRTTRVLKINLFNYKTENHSRLLALEHKAWCLRDHTVQESLNQVATWNSAMLLSEDLEEAMMAHLQNRTAKFSD